MTKENDQHYLGIIGGLSWASTQIYYRLINESYGTIRGGQSSAPLLLASVDFQPIVNAQSRGDWSKAGAILADAGIRLERAGASALRIASNTMHLVVDQISSAIKVPILNIFDATAAAIKSAGMSKVGILGTRYTMSDPFFAEQYKLRGVQVVSPSKADAGRVNEIIFRELIRNQISDDSRTYFEQVVRRMADDGAEGVIMGCTEISLLLDPKNSPVSLFDTTSLHASVGVDWLLGKTAL